MHVHLVGWVRSSSVWVKQKKKKKRSALRFDGVFVLVFLWLFIFLAHYDNELLQCADQDTIGRYKWFLLNKKEKTVFCRPTPEKKRTLNIKTVCVLRTKWFDCFLYVVFWSLFCLCCEKFTFYYRIQFILSKDRGDSVAAKQHKWNSSFSSGPHFNCANRNTNQPTKKEEQNRESCIQHIRNANIYATIRNNNSSIALKQMFKAHLCESFDGVLSNENLAPLFVLEFKQFMAT